MTRDRTLWMNDWRPGDAPTAVLEPPPERARPAPEEPAPRRPEPPAPRPPRTGAARNRRRIAMLAIAAGATAAGFALGSIRDDSNSGGSRAAATPLPASTANARPGTVGKVYAQASPAVASVRAGSGAGTGFLIDSGGTIVTNAHVVDDAREVQIRFGEDGNRISGRVLGSDPSSDLAVVKIDAGAASGVAPLTFADDSTVDVGDQVVAIGNPFGLDRTATTGIVSATGRSIEAPNGFSISDAIQTDAPINPGNSGGPLLDLSGRVIGVNSQIATSGAGGNVGVGFAVPSSLVRKVVPTLSQGGTVDRAYLGVATSERLTGAGVSVGEVVPGGPAAQAGLRPGDVITAVDGEDVSNPEDVIAAITDRSPGDRVRIARGNGDEVTVELGTRPRAAP